MTEQLNWTELIQVRYCFWSFGPNHNYSCGLVAKSCSTLWNPMDCHHWQSTNHQPSHPLLPPSLPALNFSSIRVFSSGLALCIKWPNYWNFSFSISPSNEYLGLISFRIDWFDPRDQTLWSEGLSRVYSSTTVLKHQFFGTQSSLWSNSLWSKFNV